MPSHRSILLCALALVLCAPAAAQAASGTTGRLLVTLDEPARGEPRAAAAVLALDGLRRDGAQVPQIGLVSVRPTGGRTLSSLAGALRRSPGVRSVEVERRHELRLVPNDPALTAPEVSAGTPPGTPLQWWVPRLGLPEAWDITRGAGATVAIIDTGLDGGHPEFAGKIVEAIDNDNIAGNGPATTDENGHGTHVSSIACAGSNNALGITGTGFDCGLIVIKSDLSDGSVARSIVQAADLGADAINMSFGNSGAAAPVRAVVDAVAYAAKKDIVMVAAASDSPAGEEQGDPANLLQPSGTGPDITAGRGLTVTAANFFGARASFAGRGSQISLASFGAFDDQIGPDGLFAALPGNPTQLEAGGGLLNPRPGCGCRSTLGGDSRWAYLRGTSMAAPMVAAVAAMARQFNPDARAADIIRVLKETASRPAGTGWTPELGWGILDAAAALRATRTIDGRPPLSQLSGRAAISRARSFTVRWTGSDPAPAGLVASGVDVFEVYRSANGRPYRRIATTRADRMKVRVSAGSRYRFYTIAVDRAGNREAVPPKPDLRTRVAGNR